MTMRNRKTVVVAFLVAVMLLLGVGYAALTDTLTIIGNAQIDLGTAETTFDSKVYFSASEATSSTGTGTVADVASHTQNGDDATFTANKLAVYGEQSVFTFTIKNDSNVPVDITMEPTKLSGAANPSNSNTDKFTVTYSYPNGQTIQPQGGTITVVVTVTVAEPVTSATSATFGVELTATTNESDS